MRSAQVLRHLMQMVTSQRFSPFDYGKRENLRRYGLRAPPPYRCARGFWRRGWPWCYCGRCSDYYGLCDVPVHVISGARDFLVHSDDIAEVT